MKKTVSGILLILLFTVMFLSAINVKPAKSTWTGTVYIRADGSIDPPDAPITTHDNITYLLTDNITSDGDGIVVERDNIIIDGAGYTLQGPGISRISKGIDLSGRINVTITNFTIANFQDGLYYYSYSPIPAFCKIYENNITNNGRGITTGLSSNNSIFRNNIIANAWHGIILGGSNNEVWENIFINDGLTVSPFTYGNVVQSNIVNGKPLVYLEGISDFVVVNAGQVILLRSNNITVKNLNLSNTSIGVQILESEYVKMINNSIINNNWGISLDFSSNIDIKGNSIINNHNGIDLYSSSENTISGNNITANKWYGILLGSSSNYNEVSKNNITNNDEGIWLAASSSNNTISGNNIENNRVGIELEDSSNNIIFHNNFINNMQQVYTSNSVNRWDDGYPSGGNYWNDYGGTDLYKGSNQDQHGSDDIGDVPYIIDSQNVDNYPLMYPYGSPPPPYYNLTITTTIGGTTEPPSGMYAYANSTTVPVTAFQQENYVFAYWMLDGVNVGSQNSITVLMTSNHTLQAVFLRVFNLTIITTSGGTTDPPPGTYSYMAGTTVNVTAIPESGYSFDYWLLDGEVRTENPITITMDKNYTLEAFFVDDIKPEISEPWQDPPSNNVQPNQTVTVWVNVTDYGSGIKNVTLWYSLDNGTTWETPINMTALPIPSDATITYEATIPGYENCTWITYKIVAYDKAGNNATKNNNGYYYKYYVIPEFPSTTILLPLMLTTIIATILLKRKRKPKP